MYKRYVISEIIMTDFFISQNIKINFWISIANHNQLAYGWYSIPQCPILIVEWFIEFVFNRWATATKAAIGIC